MLYKHFTEKLLGLQGIEIENIETEYEQKFVSRGSLIYKVEVSKE